MNIYTWFWKTALIATFITFANRNLFWMSDRSISGFVLLLLHPLTNVSPPQGTWGLSDSSLVVGPGFLPLLDTFAGNKPFSPSLATTAGVFAKYI